MTVNQIRARGFQPRKERGPVAKLNVLNQASCRRFMDLAWVLEARRLNIRTAHRRWLRKVGLPFPKSA